MGSTAAVLLTLVVRFYATSPDEVTLFEVGRPVAANILARAGVTPTWITCMAGDDDDECEAPGEHDVLVRVQIESHDGASRCGAASPTGAAPSGLVTLFTKCLEASSDRLFVRRSVLVGYTLAHEIGHLIIRRGHSGTGLMAAELDWRRAASDGLQFAPAEIAAIHDALEAAERAVTALAAPAR